MIWQIKEGAITWLPELALQDVPCPLPNGLTVHVRHSEIGLGVDGVVGAIPLQNGDTLQIVPKIGPINFLRLLFRSEGLQHDLVRVYDDFVKFSSEDEPGIDAIVARHLIMSVSEVMARSPKRGRVKIRREGAFAVGEMDAVASALNIACHKEDPVAYVYRERTVDIPENRVITEAVIRAWPALEILGASELRGVSEAWLHKFPRSRDLYGDLEHVGRGFATARYGGPRDYYRRTLMLAQVVLGNRGIGFGNTAYVEGDAILLNSAAVFEGYLRNVICGAYSAAGMVVSKGGIGIHSLYTDGSFELYPDIVIARDGQTLLILDAKYKQPAPSDHYQLHTYLSAHRIKRGLLLCPGMESDEVVLRERATADLTVVTEAFLPMSNLSVTEAFLATVVERFSK